MATNFSTSSSSTASPLQQDLDGKNAVITGASRGIGRAMALDFASRGASIIGTCSSPDSLHHIDSLSKEINGLYQASGLVAPSITGIAANICSLDSPTLIANAVQQHFGGQLHILVNNASFDELRPMGTLDDDYVRKCLTANTHSLVMTVELLYRQEFIQPDSRIINVSSISGRKIPYPAMYLVGATKATMEALTRTWAGLLGNDPRTKGTTVNALLVGATATERLIENAPTDIKNSAVKVLESDKPKLSTLGGDAMGRAKDVADIAALLVTEKAAWITGSVVSANGGSFYVM